MEERGGGGSEASPCVRAGQRGEPKKFPKSWHFFTFSIVSDIVFCQLIRQFFRCFQVRRIPFRQTISHTEKEEEELGAAAAAEIEKEEGEELKDVLLPPPSSPAKKVAFAVKMERLKQRILYFFTQDLSFFFFPFPPPSRAYCSWLMPPPDLLKGMGEKKGKKGLFAGMLRRKHWCQKKLTVAESRGPHPKRNVRVFG